LVEAIGEAPAGGGRAVRVSVVLTTRNFEAFVDAAIASILEQTFTDFELIVVDDGSTDATVARIASHRDPRIEVVHVGVRSAPAAANQGLRLARGEYVALWDGDDVWRPSKLARHVEAMERNKNLALTFSWCGLIDERGRELGAGFRRWRGPISSFDLLVDFVIGTNSAVVFRRRDVVAAGGFNEALSHCYDMDLCVRLSRAAGAAGVIEEELTLYRRHGGQMSRDWRPIKQDWERVLNDHREAAPAETSLAEPRARSNMERYFAYLAYESRRHAECLSLLFASLRAAPRLFVSDPRNTQLLVAAAARLVLPAGWASGLERIAIRALRR
jgi:glycosyltransferase involved in cell wall biosynthesis